MSTELVPVQAISEIERIAEHAVKSGFYPELARNQSSAVMLALRCQADGIHPGLAYSTFHVIEGKPVMRADALQARFQANGGRFKVIKWDARECTIDFWHPVLCPDPVRVTRTLEEMIKRGVARGRDGGIKKNWAQFSEGMLWARVFTAGAKAVMPGVICGVMTESEAEDIGVSSPPASTTLPEVPAAPPAAPSAAKEQMLAFRSWCDLVAEEFATTVPELLKVLVGMTVEAGLISPAKDQTPRELAKALFPAWQSDARGLVNALTVKLRPEDLVDFDFEFDDQVEEEPKPEAPAPPPPAPDPLTDAINKKRRESELVRSTEGGNDD